MNDVLVIGGGLFGQVIGHELQRRGRVVHVVDEGRPHSGTAPSGNLAKPSWFAGLGKDVTNPALELLHRNYAMQEVSFRLGPARIGKVLHLPHAEMNKLPVHRAGVRELLGRTALFDGGVRVTYELVVVAAGVWTSELVPVPGLRGLMGVSFHYAAPLEFKMDNFIRPWAPYKQVVAFWQDDATIWAGDGSAIKQENWGNRTEVCRARVDKYLPEGLSCYRATQGIRPYVPGEKPCYLAQVRPRVWVATGGAKNGTIAAAWAADTIGRATS